LLTGPINSQNPITVLVAWYLLSSGSNR
jgi:hypothetical protein